MDEHVEPSAEKACFAAVNDLVIGNAVQAIVSNSTQTATLFWVNVCKEFGETSRNAIDLATSYPVELDDVLCRFYLRLRNKNGECNKRASYLAMRASLSPHCFVELICPNLNVFQQLLLRRSTNVIDGT